MPKCEACRGRKSHSEGFVKLFVFDTFPACVFIVILFFFSSCLPLFFGDMFFIWRSSCIIRGSEKQDGEGSGHTDVRQNCYGKQTLFFSAVAHDTHENDGDPTQGG